MMSDNTEENHSDFSDDTTAVNNQIDQSNAHPLHSANHSAGRRLSWWMKESVQKNYCPIVSWFASRDAIMSTSLLWPLNDKQERWAIFYCDDTNEDAGLCMCVCVCVRVCAWPTNAPLCFIPNEGATHCQFVCPCASRNHKSSTIILPCEYHTDKVKLDISTVYSCMHVCLYRCVCVCVCCENQHHPCCDTSVLTNKYHSDRFTDIFQAFMRADSR